MSTTIASSQPPEVQKDDLVPAKTTRMRTNVTTAATTSRR